MKSPLTHLRTEKLLDLYLKNPTHGLILYGPTGIGRTYLARWLGDQLKLGVTILTKQEKLSTISIEQIRNLYSITKTGRKQMIIIENAQLMGVEAQNAFLKLLEEPPENTSFVLTTDSLDSLLSTIKSRSQHVEVCKPTEDQFKDYFNDTSSEFLQLIRSVDYLTAKVAQAITDSEYHKSTLNDMAEAKKFYSADKYLRHLILIEHNYEKDWLVNLLSNLSTILKSLIAAKSADPIALKKLTGQVKQIDQTYKSISDTPGNPKIQLTKLVEVL